MRVTVRIDGARETLAAFRELPADANKTLRERTLKLTQTLARRVQTAARTDNPQTALMAPTVRAQRDRVPAIVVGGNRKVGRNRVPAFKVLFGSEFGSNHLAQFRPWLGRGSYWFFSTVEENEPEIASAWRQVADDVIREWADDG